jgi:antitoxin component HigA of HigAB toxin-antitoxin module
MEIRPIRTDKDHKAALAEIEACWSAPEGSEQGDKLGVLLALVEIYEAKRWPTDITKRFDPIGVFNYAIDELGHSQVGLADKLTVACIGNSLAPTTAYSRMIHKIARHGKFRLIFSSVLIKSNEVA